MDPWIEGIRVILEGTPMQALSLSALHQRLKTEGGLGASRSVEWLRLTLERKPDLFRVIRTLRGPWTQATPCLTREERRGGQARGINGKGGELWILYLHRPRRVFRPEEAPIRRLQESLQSVGKALDEDSPSAVGRWVRLAEEGAALYSALCPSRSGPGRRATVSHSPSRSSMRTVNPALRVAASKASSSSRRRPLATSHPPGSRLR